MKKIYLLLLSAALCGFNVSAQCVVDPANNTIGVTPEDLGTFCEDVEINQTLQVAVPNDTTISPFGTIDFDSVFVSTDENLLPAGLGFNCANGCWIFANGDDLSRTCLDLLGTPTEPSVNGSQVITINAKVYGSTGFSSFTYDYPFDIEISILPKEDGQCLPTGLENFEIGSALSIYPNPTEGNAYINLDMPSTSNVKIELFDVIGNQVETVYNGNLGEGTNNVAIKSASDLSSGMYMLKIEIGTNTYTERLIIK